jgi:hypothetical protein
MKRIAFAITIALALLAVQAVQVVSQTAVDRSPLARQVQRVAAGKAPQRLPNGRFVPMPSAGFEQTVRELLGVSSAAAPSAPGFTQPSVGTFGCPFVYKGKGQIPDNIRANQDCGFRFQSEEWVAVNPTNSNNIVASTNDSRYFGNRTSVSFSLDGGRRWGDSELPTGRVAMANAPGGQFSFDAITDPAHAFDSQGNLYYSAIAFDAFQDGLAALLVWKANSCLQGSALHTPGSGGCDPFVAPLDATPIVVRDNFDDQLLSDDKNLMTADAHPGSPFVDNVYITWTIFRFDDTGLYLESPIFFSRSEDGGVTWSDALEISGASADCVGGDLFDPTEAPNTCNFDQGSYPIVGPDGTVYVTFNNCNTPEAAPLGGVGVCQQMLVKSTDAGNTWSDPVSVADDIGLQPFSVPGNEIDSCPLFRQCLPPNGYRMNDFPSLGIDDTTGRLAVFWADFRNGGPCATDPTFGVPVLPCDNINNDVFAAVSDDDGATWSDPLLVSSAKSLSAQWQPWGDVGEDGLLYVGYYDRGFGSCESSGCNDITLASSAAGDVWRYRRITTGSMPNLTCANNAAQCGFLGDYMSIQAFGGSVYLVWGDTRGRNVGVPEEDVFFAKVRGG